MSFRSLPFIATMLLACSSLAHSQVSVAPTFVYIDSQQPFGTVLVVNGSDKPQEVSIESKFGYPASDSLGRRFIQYDDTTRATTYSLSPWLRAFPKKFILAPGQKQTVRLMIRPPRDLEDGIYWTRLATTSTDQTPPLADADQAISARVRFVFRQVVPVIFSKGDLSTSLALEDTRVIVDDARVNILADLERDGDAPFLGSTRLRVYDEHGDLVRDVQRRSEVFFDYMEQIALDRSELPPGHYSAELSFLPERSSVGNGSLPQMAPVSANLTFTIP